MGGGNHSATPGRAPQRAGSAARPLNQPNAYGGNWTSSGFVPSHSAYNNQQGRNHDRDRHVGYGYGAIGYSFFPYGDGGYWNSNDFYGSSADDPNNQPAAGSPTGNYADNAPPPYVGPGDGGYAPYPPAYAPDNARAPYAPAGGGNGKQNGSATDGLGHPKITLIFKDGRAPMQIQNYAMSQTKLFVRDNGTDRDIAISDLDVPATMSANDQAGVDFELPVKR